MSVPSKVVSAAAFASLGCASPAWAGNEVHVRTPVLWPSTCAVVVDRSVDPLVQLDYSIPLEDTALTFDELPDSRTHQFFALCRDRALTELLPPWIARDDIERSEAAGLLEPGTPAGAILDESLDWSACFVRITADDQRRPITYAQADQGVAWDTSGVAVGVWSVAGYTFEPPLNLWSARPGFVKILDDHDDPAQDLPAIALLGSEQALEPGAAIELEACVDALGPAVIEFEWAEFAPTLSWRPLATAPVAERGALAVTIAAPVDAAGLELLVRARLIDGLGRERLAHAPVRLSVFPCPDTGCVEPESAPEPEQAGGCALVTGALAWGQPGALAWLLLPALALRRRRAGAALSVDISKSPPHTPRSLWHASPSKTALIRSPTASPSRSWPRAAPER